MRLPVQDLEPVLHWFRDRCQASWRAIARTPAWLWATRPAGARAYRGGYHHLAVVALVGVLLKAVYDYNWPVVEGVVGGAAATLAAALATVLWYQRRDRASRYARWCLLDKPFVPADAQELQAILSARIPQEQSAEADEPSQEVVIGALIKSDCLSAALRGSLKSSQAREWMRSLDRDTLREHLILDAYRDRLFGRVAPGPRGDSDIQLRSRDARDLADQWPRVVDVARKALELHRKVLLSACLRCAEACVASTLAIPDGMRDDLCELWAAGRGLERPLRLGSAHWLQVRLGKEPICPVTAGGCPGCPYAPRPVARQARLRPFARGRRRAADAAPATPLTDDLSGGDA